MIGSHPSSQVSPGNSGPAAPLARYRVSLSSGDLLPLHFPTVWLLSLPSPATNLLTPPGLPSENPSQRSTSHRASHNLLLTLLSFFPSCFLCSSRPAPASCPCNTQLSLSVRHAAFARLSHVLRMSISLPRSHPFFLLLVRGCLPPTPKTPSSCFPLTVGHSTCPGCPQHAFSSDSLWTSRASPNPCLYTLHLLTRSTALGTENMLTGPHADGNGLQRREMLE